MHAAMAAPGDCATPPHVNGAELNLLLKEAFREFCSVATTSTPQQLSGVEERYLQQLRGIIR